MTDMESLDRAVEEAERRYLSGLLPPSLADHMRRKNCAEAFVAGAEWARAEERERLVTAMVMAGRLVDEASLVLETALLPTDEPARSSEEAGNGG